MTPFLHFRSWLRGGPTAERTLTAAAASLVLALVVWASLPTSPPGSAGDDLASGEVLDSSAVGEQVGPDGTTSSGATATDSGAAEGPSGTAAGTTGAAPGSPGGSGPVATSSGAAAGGGGAGGGSATTRTTASGGPAPGTQQGAEGTSTTAARPSCGPVGATDQGVTATTITVGVVVVDLGSASGLINLPSSADVRKAYGAVLDAVNKAGGVRCRKVVAKYYTDNVFDTSSEHAACLQMQQDKVFAAFNNLFNTTEQTCLAKARIPNIWYTTPHTPDVRKYAPYILSWHPHYDQLIKHYVRGSKSQGWFTGLKKLGILEASCYPDEGVALRRELKGIGIDPGKASVFNYGCGAQTQMADQQQAASLQFKRDGVTHVMDIAYSASSGFSAAADQQAYDPEFTHMEDASATAIETGTSRPGKSFDKALLIEAIETGAQNTAGYKHNGSTKECSRILQAAGLPAPYAQPSALYFGVACVNLQMFKAMAEKAPELKRDQMALGLSRVGALELSFPSGPGNFRDAALPTGGQNWRPARWATACSCWKVVDARYRPGY